MKRLYLKNATYMACIQRCLKGDMSNFRLKQKALQRGVL